MQRHAASAARTISDRRTKREKHNSYSGGFSRKIPANIFFGFDQHDPIFNLIYRENYSLNYALLSAVVSDFFAAFGVFALIGLDVSLVAYESAD